MIRRFFLALFLFCFTLPLLATEKLNIYSVNYPLHYFIQQISGSLTKPVFSLPDTIDPAFWQPTISDVQAFQQADLILINGAGYAKWIETVSLPRRKMINTSKSFKEDYIHEKKKATHNHGTDGDHSHSGIAFTTWLDMHLANQQARAIKDALVKKLPEYTQNLENNYTSLSKDLIELDNHWKKLFKRIQEQTVLASHPIYQYLARRYQLKIQSMQWEPNTYPDEQEWRALISYLNKHPINFMLWEDEPLNKTKERLKQLGITVVVFSQAANKPEQINWLGVMKRNTKLLEQALNESGIVK